ncbi:MAG: DUF4349 domain-containing protein [Thermomicrobiales bacterium]
MNGSIRPRRVLRSWRVLAAIGGVVVVVLLATLIVGRQSGSSPIRGTAAQATSASGRPAYSNAAATTAPAAAATAARPAGVAPVLPAGTTAAASSGSRTASGGTSSDVGTILTAPLPPQTIDQKIIRTGSLTITVKDVTGTQSAIWNLANEFGGVVITSNTSGTDTNTRADISFRVPSERFREAMDRVRNYAVKVQQEQSSAQDVTEDYVDLQARQRTLQATALQLQTLLGKATTVDDTLKVQAQLTNVQSDLERITGKINYYDTRTAFSTIAVAILPVPSPIAEPVTPVAAWSFTHSVREAWNRSVNGLQNVADALVTIIIGGWWIEIPLIVGIVLLVRRERRRRPALVPSPVPVTTAASSDRAE